MPGGLDRIREILFGEILSDLDRRLARIARLEERIDATLERIEREVRQQLLDQAKAFQDELTRMRNELRFELVRELGIEADEQGNDRGSAPWTSHH